jgi:hypothetical protein
MNASVDCAFAPLVQGISYDARPRIDPQPLSIVAAPPGDAANGCKVGRTSGTTYGRISAFELERLAVDYAFGQAYFEGQIEIEGLNGTPFSELGDSGSLVFSVPSRQPVGLLFARTQTAVPRTGTVLTYANPIDAVLSALDVSIVS